MVKVVDTNGNPVNTGNCVMVDSRIKTFSVQIQTIGTVTPETIKRILQRELKVLNVMETETIIVVR